MRILFLSFLTILLPGISNAQLSLAVYQNNACSIEDAVVEFTIDFVSGSPADVAEFVWDFGDGTTTTQTNNFLAAEHQYPGPGVYNATLVVTTTSGSTYSPTVPPVVYMFLDPTFSVTPAIVQPGGTVTYTYLGDDTFNPPAVQGYETVFEAEWSDNNGWSWSAPPGSWPYTSPTLAYGANFVSNPFPSSPDPGVYEVTLSLVYKPLTDPDGGCSASSTHTVIVSSDPNIADNGCCENSIPIEGLGNNSVGNLGQFYIENTSGQVSFVPNGCPDETPLTCVQGNGSPIILDKVVAATAITYKETWPYNESNYYTTNANLTPNDFEKGTANKWRPEQQRVYRELLDQQLLATAATDDYKNYDRGTFPMELFDWKNDGTTNNPDKWLLTNTIDAYTPNGQVREDHTNLGVYSTAQYGYNNTLMYLVAQNAEDNSVAYESFENQYSVGGSSYMENGVPLDQTYGTIEQPNDPANVHTGKYAVKMATTGGQPFRTARLTLNQQLISEGMLIRVWMRVQQNSKRDLVDDSYPISSLLSARLGNGTSWLGPGHYMREVSKAGQWALFEVVVSGSAFASVGLSAGDSFDIGIHTRMQDGNYVVGDVWMDDVRIQPLHSEMECYVYDYAQRIVAAFDDEHYGMLYQYNAEGLLVRKQKETREGIKTISETQYNSQGTDRQ